MKRVLGTALILSTALIFFRRHAILPRDPAARERQA